MQLKEDELKETLLEMEIIKACSHPNITRYMGCFLKGLDLWVSICILLWLSMTSMSMIFFDQPVSLYIVQICMEFCGGGALDSLYRGNILSTKPLMTTNSSAMIKI